MVYSVEPLEYDSLCYSDSTLFAIREVLFFLYFARLADPRFSLHWLHSILHVRQRLCLVPSHNTWILLASPKLIFKSSVGFPTPPFFWPILKSQSPERVKSPESSEPEDIDAVGVLRRRVWRSVSKVIYWFDETDRQFVEQGSARACGLGVSHGTRVDRTDPCRFGSLVDRSLGHCSLAFSIPLFSSTPLTVKNSSSSLSEPSVTSDC